MIMQEFDTFNYRFDSKLRPYIHSHSANEIYYFHGGKCQYLLGGDLIDLIPGDLVVMNGIREHGPIMDDRHQYIRSAIMFERDALKSMALMPGIVDLSRPFRVSTYYRWNLQGELKEEFELLLGQLHRFHRQHSEVAMNRRNMKFYELLLFVYERFDETADAHKSAPSEQEQLIHQALFYIDDHYMDELSAESIAARLHVSKSYLMKLFKKYTNETLFDYITRRRISQAKLLFTASPARSVTEVCHMTGFKDASHFSRTFKKTAGLAPEQYRKLLFGLGARTEQRQS